MSNAESTGAASRIARPCYGHDEHPVTIAMIWGVPMSLGIFLIRLLAGHKRMVLAFFLDWMVLPLATFLLLGVVFALRENLTDFTAVLLLVGSRVLLLFVLLGLLWPVRTRQYRARPTSYRAQEWLVGALPFLVTTLVLGAMGQSGTLISEAHHATEEAVGDLCRRAPGRLFPAAGALRNQRAGHAETGGALQDARGRTTDIPYLRAIVGAGR